MSRKGSHCSLHGHNSRTCFDRVGIKLFGVHLTEPRPVCPMRKCFSTGNLSSYASPEDPQPQPQPQRDMGAGYVSDDLVHTNSIARQRKKGVVWTEEEHRSFLLGLQKLGKGDWRGISNKFVKTRTPTQVASHAQKYFLRRGNLVKRRRRSSLFDITPDTASSLFAQEKPAFEEAAREGSDVFPHIRQSSNAHGLAVGDCRVVETTGIARHRLPVTGFNKPSTQLSPSPKVFETEEVGAAEESAELEEMETAEASDFPFFQATASIPDIPWVAGCNCVGALPNHACLFFPVLFPLWCESLPESFEQQESSSFKSKVVRPIPIIPAAPLSTDDSLKISGRSFRIARPVMQPTALSLKLLEEGSRHSAFEAMPSLGGSKLDTRPNLKSGISVA